MKSTVFIGKEITFEYENVVAVRDMGFKIELYLFGGFIQSLEDSTEMANFRIWYHIFLENKYLVEVGEEEIVGL